MGYIYYRVTVLLHRFTVLHRVTVLLQPMLTSSLYLTQSHPHFLGSPPFYNENARAVDRFQTSCQDSLLSDSFDMVPLTNG